jgi:hypothetical protein
MSRSHILSLLKDKGKTVSFIARKFNVHVQSVYESLDGKGSRRIRVEISLLVGRPPSLLFPNTPQKIKIVDDYEFMNALNSSTSKSSLGK